METATGCLAGPPLRDEPTGWVLRSHADVRWALGDPRFVVPPAAPGDADGALGRLRSSVSRFSNGAEHVRRRAVAQAEIDRLDAGRLRERAARWTAAVIGRAGGERFDVMAQLARRVPVRALCDALGAGGEGLDGAVDDVISVAAAWHPGAGDFWRSRAEPAVQRLTKLLGGAGDETTANRIGVLVQACDATAGLIGNALNLALRLPPGGPWPVASILAETLRYDPPARATRRRATAPVRLGGHTLEAGTAVRLDLAAANRDPAVFADPHRFDPGRAESPHLAFGQGRRPCPGGHLALALAGGVVQTVLDRCRLADPQVAFEPSPNLRIPSRLEVACR
jgi:cytochrome P450